MFAKKLLRWLRYRAAKRRHKAKIAEAVRLAAALQKFLREHGLHAAGSFVVVRLGFWWCVVDRSGLVVDQFATLSVAVKRCHQLVAQRAECN